MTDDNPYKSPAADSEANEERRHGKTRSQTQEEPWEEQVTTDTVFPRYFAAIVDILLCFVLAIIAGKQISNDYPIAQFCAAVGVCLGYFVLFEGLFARTPGKLWTGLIVIDMDGRRAGWRAALIRTFWRVLEANPFLLGALPAAISVIASKTHQRWGDRFARTLVVPKRRL